MLETNWWKIEEREWGLVLTLREDWDLDKANEFSAFAHQHLAQKKPGNFVVDMSHVDYIDSMTLGVLVNLHRLFQERGGGLYLLSLSPTVEKIFKESGVYVLFTVFNKLKALEKYLKSLDVN